MSRHTTKPTKWLCTQRKPRSAWASAQSDQSSLCTLWVANDPSFPHADREDSDQTGRVPRLICLHWAHMPFCYTRYILWRRYYVIHSELFERPSISASFPDSNLSSFWPIFFKLCMDIDIREEWFGIAIMLNSFINNRVMALDWCKNVFFLNIFRTNGWILIKFCIYIDKYKIQVVSNAHYFWSIFNRVMVLDRRQNFVYAQYLVN